MERRRNQQIKKKQSAEINEWKTKKQRPDRGRMYEWKKKEKKRTLKDQQIKSEGERRKRSNIYYRD